MEHFTVSPLGLLYSLVQLSQNGMHRIVGLGLGQTQPIMFRKVELYVIWLCNELYITLFCYLIKGSDAYIGFRCNLMLSYFGMHTTKAAFFEHFQLLDTVYHQCGHLCIISVPLRTVLGNTDLCNVNTKQ